VKTDLARIDLHENRSARRLESSLPEVAVDEHAHAYR
jgi:hypothetical protein